MACFNLKHLYILLVPSKSIRSHQNFGQTDNNEQRTGMNHCTAQEDLSFGAMNNQGYVGSLQNGDC